ncbi:hypothetical protein [Megasphaera elsdenii]|uniref:Uncharacterized protein n=1 Tax=Megasphaera elsdenii CAG:570 TaxID=1263087 RepID=R7MX26_MEGEL|nr:hypothetical protein [Megasphaera elsdenii]CDF04432.1 uncharacterized protein BN715_00792 [Megasphaera elsdenii CAG:570]
MKDYLIKFGDDGRRGATYAEGIHYFVDKKGNVTNGKVKVSDLLADGYVFVDTADYLNLLGNNDDNKEYCRQADGSFAPYVAPDPTEAEQKAAKINEIKAKYNSQLDAMVTARVKATMLGSDTSKIDANYKSTLAAMAAEIKNA